MSYSVVRGAPTAAQLYLDGILDRVLEDNGVQPDPTLREQVALSQVLFYCLKKNLGSTFMINGATGEVITNEQLLKRAVPLARSLTAQSMKGMQAMVLMRNHQHTAAVYFASIFAGIKAFMMDPNTTVYELTHFLNLIEPRIVFCDREFYEALHVAMPDGLSPKIVVADEAGQLEQLSAGYSDDIDSYQVAKSLPEDTVIYLPTSGSSGLPKAAKLHNRGLVIQLPLIWSYHSQFPTPTELVMILTTIQWATFTMTITSCVVNNVPILISPKMTTVEHVCDLLGKYRPTWTFLSPAFASGLVVSVTKEQMSSVQTLILLGAPATPELMTAIKEKLPVTAHLCDGYGTTETHGFITLPDRDAPFKSTGKMLNIFQYKIVDDNGRALGLNQTGELHVKGASVIKGYYKNEKTSKETFTSDGWYKTGDVFHVDENEQFFFIIRKKFSFKYKGSQVSPEEVERVIGSVPGVHECVVIGTENGPTAAVVLQPNSQITREEIKKAVDATLSDHKRLHGGIAFVESLPHTHSGKVKRPDCSKLLEDLLKSGLCY